MLRKICVVVTSRASYARIKSVLRAIKKHPELELQLVVGASLLLEKYGEAIEVIERDGFEPNARVHMVLEGENPVAMAKTTGLGLMELSTTFDNLKPDVVLTVADRYETLATAVAACYMNIPVAHVQGGEITGSIDEKVRHAVTKFSNLHFVSNDACAERVIRMGEASETVFVTGCPSIDLAVEVMKDYPKGDFDPFKQYGGVGAGLNVAAPYMIVLQHPVTTEYEQSHEQIWATLMAVHELEVPTFWFWPNVDAGSDKVSKGIRVFRERYKPSFVYYLKNISPEDFLELLCGSQCIVGNSSVGIRESSFLGVPSVNIGNRQWGRERADNVIDVSHDKEDIKRAILKQIQKGKYSPSHIYGDGGAGERIVKVLAEVELSVEKRFCYSE
ncbi:UDP-N-acetylglucosamine 2-epimerase [Chloroflexota bacterium]